MTALVMLIVTIVMRLTMTAGRMRLAYNDKVHGYWFNGTRTRSITEIAKMAEDTGRLEKWHDRKIAIGLASERGAALLDAVRVNLDDNAEINAICELAVAEAGAHEGRDRGVVIHKAVEQFDLGKKIIVSSLTSPVIGNWQMLLDKMGWTVKHIEQVVVWPDHNIAGRFDRIVEGAPCPECGRTLYVVDFKTGQQILRYPKSICNQLYMYAAAPLLCEPFQLIDKKGFTERIGPMPDVCLCTGYVAHYPPDAAPNLIAMNLKLGRYGTEEILFPIQAWRKRPVEEFAEVIIEDDGPPILPPDDDDEDLFEDAYNQLVETTSERDPADSGVPAADPADARPDALTHDARQNNLHTRLIYIKKNHPQIAKEVARRWPEGVGKINTPLADTDLDAIEALVIEAERYVEAPFNPIEVQLGLVSGDALPATQSRPQQDAPPAPEPPLEGKHMKPWRLGQLQDAYDRLDDDNLARVDTWAREANEAGLPISLAAHPSIRRFHIAQLMLLALHHDDDTMRSVIAKATGHSSIHVPIGALLGALTQAQVARAWTAMLEEDAKTAP